MSAAPFGLDAVNAMGDREFVERFGDVAEHAPWVAEYALGIRPYRDREAMIAAFADAVGQARRDAQLELIRSHPDLAGRAAVDGSLTEDSREEQAGVGLDRLTKDEYEQFARLNGAYVEKFGFPFILAVKGANKHMILKAFRQRLDNDADTEFATALEQIARIIRLRLEQRVLDTTGESVR